MYIGNRLTGYEKKQLIADILKIIVQLLVNRLQFHSSNLNVLFLYINCIGCLKFCQAALTPVMLKVC